MSNYNTGNPVPSIDPRDLDDNATVFDLLLQSTAASVPDRLGAQRKTWAQMEEDAAALVSPNVAALAELVPAIDSAFFFNATSPVGMGSYTLSSFTRGLAPLTTQAAYRTAIGAISSADNITGSAAKITTPRNIALTGDGAWNVDFDGSAGVTAALTLSATGVAAGTYGSVTVNAKGLVTAASTVTPAANGGTGQNTIALAVDAFRAIKPTWTAYTPTITATSGTFTTVTATGKYVVLFGVCHWQAKITVTTKGTGTRPVITLPVAALNGSNDMPIPLKEVLVNGKTGAAKIQASLTTAVVEDYNAADILTADGCLININGSYPVA